MFKEITQDVTKHIITLKNIQSNSCIGNDDEDRYDISLRSSQCRVNGEEQFFKFVDLTAYDYFTNEIYNGAKKYPFLRKWVYLKNEKTNTCMKFNGIDKPVTDEKCKNLNEFQWKIININHRKFYIVTKKEEYIKLRAQCRFYKEFRLEYAASDLCFEYKKESPIITQGECCYTEKGQLIIPTLVKPLDKSKENKKKTTPSVCIPPMVKKDPSDPNSPCVPPKTPTPSVCIPPMVKKDPSDPNSPCVEKEENDLPIEPIIPFIISECTPPMIREDPSDPNSPCVKPNPIDPVHPIDLKIPSVSNSCGDIKLNFRPFFKIVNSTIINVSDKLCAKNNSISDKIEIRGFINSSTPSLLNELLSVIEIKFLNLKTLNIFIPEIYQDKYIIQIPKGRYKIMVSAPKFANFKYETNLLSSSCEERAENTITLLPPSKSGVEITLTPVVPVVTVGDKVKICNSSDFNPGYMSPQKKKFINLRGEIINSMQANNNKLKLDTNNMNDDVVIYLHGIKDLLENGHTKLHILTDDGNQHSIDIPGNKDCNKEKIVVGQIDKDTKKFKKSINN